MALSLVRATIISTILQAIVYGCSVFMFAITLWVPTSRRHKKTANWYMIIVAILLFSISTARMILDSDRLVRGLLDEANFPLGGSSGWLGNPAEPSYIARNALMVIENLLADSVIIYRAYVVWQSLWVIAVPVTLLLGLLSLGTYNLTQAAQVHVGAPFNPVTQHLITAYFALSLAANSSATLLLVYRLWSFNREASQYGRVGTSAVKSVILTILDAAIVYWALILTTLVTIVFSDVTHFIFLDLIVPTAASTIYIIFVRSALVASRERNKSVATGGSSGTRSFGGSRNPRTVQISVTQLHETDETESYNLSSPRKPGSVLSRNDRLELRDSI